MTRGEDKKRSKPKCFEFDTNIDCEPTTNFTTIGIAIVAIIRDNEACSKKVEELNDQYGTYYHQGVEYPIANENNPRYNEDAGNDDALVTST